MSGTAELDVFAADFVGVTRPVPDSTENALSEVGLSEAGIVHGVVVFGGVGP
jgi:hypothetical protein